MNIDYNLYKIFLYLYEEKNISKTASKLYVSQPAVSYSLKELETQLGYKLFYRNSKGIEPTEEAKELYTYVSTAFNIFNDAEEHLKNLNNLNIGCIKIGLPSELSISYLSEYIVDFRNKYPGIKFEIISSSSSNMLEMLETRKLDLIFDYLPVDTKRNISKITLTKLNNCFVYNKKVLGNLNINEICDLKNYSLLLPTKTLTTRKKLNEYLESQNINLIPTIESNNFETLFELVKNGLGIGYFIEDEIKNKIETDDYEIIEFKDLPSVDVCSIYIEEFLTAASKKFIESLKIY